MNEPKGDGEPMTPEQEWRQQWQPQGDGVIQALSSVLVVLALVVAMLAVAWLGLHLLAAIVDLLWRHLL